jgi:hypothetical protein
LKNKPDIGNRRLIFGPWKPKVKGGETAQGTAHSDAIPELSL